MSNEQHLGQLLSHIDGRGYKAYKQIKGSYEFPDFTLYIDHVQGDPFALPSKIRLRVDQKRAQIPVGLWSNSVRQVALEDFIARAVRQSVQDLVSPKKGSGRFYDSNVAKKWIATGTVLGTGTMPLNAAYGEPMSFGQDFYKGFGQQKKQKKKKGRR